MTDFEKKLNEHASATLGSYSKIDTGGKMSESQKMRVQNLAQDRENSSRNLYDEERKRQIKLRKPYKAPDNKLKPIPKAKPLAPVKPAPQLKKL